MSLSLGSSRLFYSQKVGIYREVFPPIKSIAIIWFFIALLQAPFIASFMIFFYFKAYFPIVFVLATIIGVQGIVTLIYICSMTVENSVTPSDGSRSSIYFVSCLTSWIAPFTVIANQPAKKFKYLLVAGCVTALSYILTVCCILFFHFKILESPALSNYIPLAVPVCVLIFSTLTVLNYLGNYHNLYKISKCCCCSPIVHRSMIYDYLASPELLDLNTNEDFPTFFKAFLNENKLNVPLPQTGDTVLHVAFRHERFK